MPDEIRPIEPKGLEMIPTKSEIPNPQPVDVPNNIPAIDDSVSSFNIILMWMKEQLISYITKAKAGEAVPTIGVPDVWKYAVAFLLGIIATLVIVHIF